MALIDGITMGGVSIYAKLFSCYTNSPADGAVCPNLAEYSINEARGDVVQLDLCLLDDKINGQSVPL